MTAPIVVSDDLIERVRQLAGSGLNVAQIAAMTGMSSRSMYNKIKEYPEMRAAIDEGRNKACAMVVNRLFAKCMEGDYSSIQFFLRNVAPQDWGDTRKLSLEKMESAPTVDLSDVSDEALMELAQAPVATIEYSESS